MINGHIDKDWKGNLVVVYEYKEGFHKVIEEIPLHPYYDYDNTLEVGQPIKFQFAKECTIHYPHYCDCFKLKTFAIVDMSKKPTLWQKFKSLFKKR